MKDSITPRATDYSEWYQDVIASADLAEHGPVRGTMVIKPYGYALWETIQKYLDSKFKETGVKNAYFPMLIPESLLKKEEKHVEGFSPEVAVVTFAGGKELEERLIIRPTSETIMYEVFSKWIRSHRDLPLLINQWSNVVRWEMRPRLFMRTTEFLWQEGHTAHATLEEADIRARQMLKIYEDFARDVLAIPVIPGIKSENEKFAGAFNTYTIEAMMQDGKALQLATSHNLGQNFARVFDVKFTDNSNNYEYVWQTSWGLSTRTIGGLIMAHSDDKGLVLPPSIASTKAVIIPIWKDEETKNIVLKSSQELLKDLNISHQGEIILDDTDGRSGEKHFKWEKRGVPVRIEIGPRDIEAGNIVIVRRDNNEKTTVVRSELKDLHAILSSIQENLYSKALKLLKERTKEVDTWEDFKKYIEEGYFVSAFWDGKDDTEKKIKDETKATVRCIPFEELKQKGKCIFSGEDSNGRVIFARSY
jgi:prolyl-tRNA synthetase